VNGSLPVLMNRSEIKRSHSICADRAARRDAPIQVPLNLDQEALAATMRTAWANFAANGDPSSAAVSVALLQRRAYDVARAAADGDC